LISLFDLSGDNHLKLHVKSGADNWAIMSRSAYPDSQGPLHVKQPMGQFAYLQLRLWSRRSAPLAFPSGGGRSSPDLVPFLDWFPVAICSAMIDAAGGARHG